MKPTTVLSILLIVCLFLLPGCIDHENYSCDQRDSRKCWSDCKVKNVSDQPQCVDNCKKALGCETNANLYS